MRYIDVVSKFKYTRCVQDPTPLIINQSDGQLVSLVSLCKIKNNGARHLVSEMGKLEDYYETYHKEKKYSIWLDSGGYNLLSKWKLTESNLSDYIQIYHGVMENNGKFFDKIFSLDCPIAVQKGKIYNSWFNTRKQIYKWNKDSLTESIKCISSHEALRNKFIFVYNFRTKSMYDIWSKLYDTLNLKDVIVNRAIGGLVGVYDASKKANHKDLYFSPVIGPAFKCFYDYLTAKKDIDFNLHFLGINTPIDQFVIIFLENLFSHYLDELGFQHRACFSVDTRAHSTKMDKSLRSAGVYSFNPAKFANVIHRDHKIIDVAGTRLKHAYPLPCNPLDITEHCLFIEIEKILWNKRVKSAAAFYPLSLYSNNNLIKYFDYFINGNNLVEKLCEATDIVQFEKHIEELFNDLLPIVDHSESETFLSLLMRAQEITDISIKTKLKEGIDVRAEEFNKLCRNPTADRLTPLYSLFKGSYSYERLSKLPNGTLKATPNYNRKSNLDYKIKTSLSKILEFHQWFTHSKSKEKLKTLMNKFISDIGIKDDLKRN